MKTIFTRMVIAYLLFYSFSARSQSTTASSTLPEGVSNDWFTDASAYVNQMEYDFYPAADHDFRTTNAKNGVSFMINEKGYTASGLKGAKEESWQVEMLLNNIGRTCSATKFTANDNITRHNNSLLHSFGFADVEYLNNEAGMRQNFIIHNRPGGEGRLRVGIQVRSSLSHKLLNNSKLVFYQGDKERLAYEDLNVWDANKNKLEAWMEWDETNNLLSLVVNDKNAVYPVTVDPLNKTSEWTSSADGIIPALLNSLSLQVYTLYGYTVVNLGDVNNDGYHDVAIGAPGMADVVVGAGTTLGVGAVFVYYGSSTGLPAVPSKVLQPSGALAGACFGYSIAAGNISADGINDIIVGAPLDTYATTIPDLIGTQVVNVTAGAVYYYRSEDLGASSNPPPSQKIRLQGGSFFSAGILGLLNNLTAKGLFGLSIATSNDLNGDGREDIVIGAPAYIGVSLFAVKQGAAFVYYSNNLATTSPVSLSVPTPSILGLVSLPLINLNGLLFGFSVEGTGDYNNDGNPDVVVGAPAGIDLSSLGGIFSGQVLGGSAYVYYGNGTGVNTAIGATLQASSSGLLGNAANLFGYRIRAVRNAAGIKNGNILVSAPSGSVLSNVTGGLQLKAGQLHVFKKKTAAFTSPVSSDQALSSPRATAITSLLTGQNLNVSMLYAAGTDNMLDANCDGFGDIIVGEPMSSNVPLIGANVTGGAAYIYLGQSDGTYQASPAWTLTTSVSSLLGVNATALVGWSVAGGVDSYGPASTVNRAIIGGPSNTLDFGSGLLNLGNTLGTLTSFTFDNNGIGKAYSFNPGLCLITLPARLTKFDGQIVDKTVQLNWKSEDEMNVSRYELQRSTDGSHFETIALVFAENGQHNEYAYPDRHPFNGVNYYRLMIVDNDSRLTYSNTISFRFNEILPGFMVVAPNPVRETIRVKFAGFESGDYSLKLYNASGLLVAMKKINLSQHDQVEQIQRSAGMQPGTYWLNLYDNKEKKVRTVNLVIGDW